MRFGTFPICECEGAILAHSLRLPDLVIKKGTRLSSTDIDEISKYEISELVVAILEADDVVEDEAASEIAHALAFSGIELSEAGTGRVNFHAAHNGVFVVSKEIVDAINSIDPGITFATLANHEPVLKGRMVATIKIIPYGISRQSLKAVEAVTDQAMALKVAPYSAFRVGVISTLLPGLKDKTIAKTIDVLERRLSPSGSKIIAHTMAKHAAISIKAEIDKLKSKCDLIILFGASAISDLDDEIPLALRQAGGNVLRLGMPVDPGNLLMLGEIGDVPVLGAPGCARSPAENGFDFVLDRLLSGIKVSSDDIAGMGVGGLLMEIGSRPQPRKPKALGANHIAAIVLAGGQSRRMGSVNKLTAMLNDKPMVSYPVEAAAGAGIDDIVVVTRHQSDEVRKALGDMKVRFVENPDYSEGLSTSLKVGLSALGEGATHALILLGDMPEISKDMIAELIAATGKSPENSIMVSTCLGKRGNPVLWPKAYFEELLNVSGDTGARHVIGENSEKVVEVELGKAASLDLDTPEAFAAFLAKQGR